MINVFRKKELASTQYHGDTATTNSCLLAVVRIVQSGANIRFARLLSAQGYHALLLKLDSSEPIVVRHGFTSGYPGEGPAGLAMVIHLLESHSVDVEEVVVDIKLLERIGDAALTAADIEFIEHAPLVRPKRTGEYKYLGFTGRGSLDIAVKGLFPLIIPFGLVDSRIYNLALRIPEGPDASVLPAFRLLEHIVRQRAGFPHDVVGNKLFANAFRGESSPLYWPGLPEGEVEGRTQMFIGAFLTFRNPRSHREIEVDDRVTLREFLIVNELFLLESEAVERQLVA